MLISGTTVDQIPMRTISSLTGVNPNTQRTWERRYGLLLSAVAVEWPSYRYYDHLEQILRSLPLLSSGAVYAAGPWQPHIAWMSAALVSIDQALADLAGGECSRALFCELPAQQGQCACTLDLARGLT